VNFRQYTPWNFANYWRKSYWRRVVTAKLLQHSNALNSYLWTKFQVKSSFNSSYLIGNVSSQTRSYTSGSSLVSLVEYCYRAKNVKSKCSSDGTFQAVTSKICFMLFLIYFRFEINYIDIFSNCSYIAS
jgi:hypothetical protein